MIDLPIVISRLSLGVEVGIGTPGDCEDCAMGGEGIRLLWVILNLWQRWRWSVGFGFDLKVGIVWHWMCDLWHRWRIGYLWSW
jgi:hypothetical protein